MRQRIQNKKRKGSAVRSCKLKRGLYCRGSFTVEAAFLFPMIVLLAAFVLHVSMDWYEVVHEASADVDALLQLDTRTCFINQSALREVLSFFD
ncbi:MAG: hypothetical protein LUC83_10680 [Clostridiales bacterium]|nr:hypothetical protein [Clostridiales bacterium]